MKEGKRLIDDETLRDENIAHGENSITKQIHD